MTVHPTDPQLLDLLEAAVAEGPPAALRGRILGGLSPRPPGRGPLSPVESIAGLVDDITALLTDLSPVEWTAPTVNRLDVRTMVGHLTGSDTYLGSRFGFWPPEHDEVDPLDHLGASQPAIDRAAASDPLTVASEWRRGADDLVDHLRSLPTERLGAPCSYHSVTGTGHDVLVARSFELWTHLDDLCRAVGRAPARPPADRLSLMTDLASHLVAPAAAVAGAASGAALPDTTLRLVLTGPGGGCWDRQLGNGGPDGEPGTVLVADTLAFCWLVAGRLSADDLDAEITGDPRPAELVLAGLPSFALD